MDHRRLLGVALAAVSACGYGSGALFAKSVYGAGIDWLALLYWRFLIGGAIVWAWTLLMSDNRAALRALSARVPGRAPDLFTGSDPTLRPAENPAGRHGSTPAGATATARRTCIGPVRRRISSSASLRTNNAPA